MESNNRIDKIFRESLINNSVQPPSEIKHAVFAALDKKEKVKPFLTWGRSMVAVLTIATISAGIWWSGNMTSDSENKPVTEISATAPESNLKQINNTDLTAKANTSVENNPSSSIEISPAPNNVAIGKPEIAKPQPKEISNSVYSKRAKNNAAAKSGNTEKTESKPANLDNLTADSEKHLKNKETIETKNTPVENQTLISSGNSSNKNETSISTVHEEIQTTAPSSKEVIGEDISKSKNTKEISAFAFEFAAGPSFISSKIATNKTGNSEYTSMIEDAESELLSANAALEFSIQLKNKAFIQTGINYDWINESFKYQSPATGPVASTTYDETNKYEYLSIPVLFGMNFELNKFSIRPQGGISIMMLTKAEGYSIDFETKQAVKFDKEALPFNKNMLAVMFRADLQYQFTDHIGICLQPGVRLSTRSVYSVDYPIGKELTRFTVNAGFQYKF